MPSQVSCVERVIQRAKKAGSTVREPGYSWIWTEVVELDKIEMMRLW